MLLLSHTVHFHDLQIHMNMCDPVDSSSTPTQVAFSLGEIWNGLCGVRVCVCACARRHECECVYLWRMIKFLGRLPKTTSPFSELLF